MTCIVGLVRGERVYLGADSGAADAENSFIECWKTPKIFKRESFLFAFAGSYAVGQLLRFSLTLPEFKGGDVEEYLVTKFIPAFKKALIKEGIKEIENWTLLIGHGSRLFVLEMEFGLGEPFDRYTADGAGRDYAIGALTAIFDLSNSLSAEECVTLALKAAEKYCQDVRGPFIIAST